MPVVEIQKDPKALTMTVVAQFAAPVARVWAAYADPRQLERFWGPPEWPATFYRHDVFPGGVSHYSMTGKLPDQNVAAWTATLAVLSGGIEPDAKPSRAKQR